MKFDFGKYKGKYAMHCKTEEEAKDFCRVIHEDGRTWSNGMSYFPDPTWYGIDTCYSFNKGEYCDIYWWKKDDYTILEWEDYMEKKFTKADLRDGMVGITREGDKFVLLCGKFRNGATYWGVSDDLTEDFKNSDPHFSELDLMQICTSSAEVLDEWFYDEYLTPVWTRPAEDVEMTMTEIKTALKIYGTLKIKEEKQ